MGSTDQNFSELRLRAIVIDDNKQMRELLHDLLRRAGIQSVEHEDANAALAIMERIKPHLILTDLAMEPVNGITFVERLRHLTNQDVQTTPVIMITGHADREVVRLARDAGVNEVLAKPITAKSLHQRLHEVIFRPRPFVFGPDFYGPCRRRRADENYNGPERRKTVSVLDV